MHIFPLFLYAKTDNQIKANSLATVFLQMDQMRIPAHNFVYCALSNLNRRYTAFTLCLIHFVESDEMSISFPIKKRKQINYPTLLFG